MPERRHTCPLHLAGEAAVEAQYLSGIGIWKGGDITDIYHISYVKDIKI